MNNLDMIAAQKANAIINATMGDGKPDKADKNDVENVVTKALGVMQEQGVFAGMLYLLSRPKREKPIAEAVRNQLVALLGDPALQPFNLSYPKTEDVNNAQKLLKHFAETVCASPIHTLLLVKNLFEQTLMYARYSAKAQPENKKKGNQPAEENKE